MSRSFDSFSEAATEAGQSRIYGGIHWQNDNTFGQESGTMIAQNLLDNFFGLMGDLDHDGDVDVYDLLALLGAWGLCPDGSTCPADLNNDGIVNGLDLIRLVLRFTH